jgi:hypothetical protein
MSRISRGKAVWTFSTNGRHMPQEYTSRATFKFPLHPAGNHNHVTILPTSPHIRSKRKESSFGHSMNPTYVSHITVSRQWLAINKRLTSMVRWPDGA